MLITENAKKLQGIDFKCIVADSLKDDTPSHDLMKALADRAASMAESSCGMRSGKIIAGSKILYWIYNWDVNSLKTDPPLFFITADSKEYEKWRDEFLRAEITPSQNSSN